MKKVAVLFLIGCLFQICAYAADTAQSPAAMGPVVQQATGEKLDARLGPSIYPQFTDFKNSTDAACEAYLKEDFSKGGFSLAPICQTSKFGNGFVGGPCNDFLPVDELVIRNFAIGDSYRKTAKILVTWTVRLEGTSIMYSVNPEFGLNWYGTVTEYFPKGMVKTALYINGKKMGTEVALEIPSTGTQTVTEVPPSSGGDEGGGATGNPSGMFGGMDPTLVGTYVLKASDFPGGVFPASIDLIEIRWKNETAMDIVSPAGMRNLIINMLPVTKQAE